MKCPFCEQENLEGVDRCEACGQNLGAIQVSRTTTKRHQGFLGATLEEVGILDALKVAPGDSVANAVDMMSDAEYASVFVVDGEKLLGIFTERDLVSRVDPAANLAEISIESVMTVDPFTYKASDTVAYALNGMTIWGNRHLPIVDDGGELQGFVGVRPLLGFIREKLGT